MLEKFFKLSENHTDAKTEILAGITTFMTMAYILAVNPRIMAATGMDSGAVFTATALAAFIGTLLMAIFANYPFCLLYTSSLNSSPVRNNYAKQILPLLFSPQTAEAIASSH